MASLDTELALPLAPGSALAPAASILLASLRPVPHKTISVSLTNTHAAVQSLKQQYRQHAVVPEGTAAPRLPIQFMLGFGAVSGLIAQTVTYPLDVVRRRMQARLGFHPLHPPCPCKQRSLILHHPGREQGLRVNTGAYGLAVQTSSPWL